MAMGLPSFVCGSGVTSEETSQKVSQGQGEQLRLKTDNALDLKSYIGKDFNSLNIPVEAVKYIGAHPFTVYYEGSFLGYPCTSIVMGINYDYKTKIDTVKSITISCKQPNFMECKAYLDEQLGECYYSGSAPYAAVNGGAVIYFTYFKDGYKHHLQMASERNYYTLDISMDEPKGAPRHESTGMVTMQNFVPLTPLAPVCQPVAPVNNQETWACDECGFSTNKGKFCVECGKPRKR